MKTIKTKLFTLLVLLFIACSKDETSTPVANDEAADMLSTSISSSSGGVAVVIDDSAVTTKANDGARIATCGYTESKDTSIVNTPGAAITYNYDFQYDYALLCTTAIPTSMNVNMTYSGVFDGLRLSTNTTGTGSLVVKTLDASFTYFTVNGTYTRTGSFTSKVRDKNTSNSVITITLTDVTVNKTTRMITGGTASVSITGTVTGKGSLSYTGTITFKGNKEAELDINGTQYTVNLETGEVTAS